jgi:hypothetical protein
VTDKYLHERPAWTIHPCQNCGFSELFDAPSDLIRVVFPNIPPGAVMQSFTSFCPLCGGVQAIELTNETVLAQQRETEKKSWWKFW